MTTNTLSLRIVSDGTPRGTKIYDIHTGRLLTASKACIELYPAQEYGPVSLGLGDGEMSTYASYDVIGEDEEGRRYRFVCINISMPSQLFDLDHNPISFTFVRWSLSVEDQMARIDFEEIKDESHQR